MLDLVAGARRDHKSQPIAAGMMAGIGDDLHNVAALQLGAQRHHAGVHFGAHTALAHFGVDGVGKIHRRGVARQNDHLALGSEGVNLFWVKIEFEAAEEFAGVFDVFLPVHHLPQPRQPLFVFGGDWHAVFVFPVGGDAVFAHVVHLFGADLHLEGRAILRDHGGMQRLVKIGPRHGDEILDAPSHRPPQVVDGAQRAVAVFYFLGDDADGQEVIDLVHGDALALQLLVNAPVALDAALHSRLNAIFF